VSAAQSFDFVPPTAATEVVGEIIDRVIYVHFENKEGIDSFAFEMGQTINHSTRDLWYPASDRKMTVKLPDNAFENKNLEVSLWAQFDKKWWEDAWQGMPEFISEDLAPWRSINVHFAKQEDVDAFAVLVDQGITELTKWIWYPEAEIQKVNDKRWVSTLK
jgi:hypothetical protein